MRISDWSSDVCSSDLGALCAAPSYLRDHGVPAHPRDVLRHHCIRTRFASGALTGWHFEKAGEVLAFDPPARLVLTTASAGAAIDLAAAGPGLFSTFRNWVQPPFYRGSLTPVLPEWWPEFHGSRPYFSSRLLPTPSRPPPTLASPP